MRQMTNLTGFLDWLMPATVPFTVGLLGKPMPPAMPSTVSDHQGNVAYQPGSEHKKMDLTEKDGFDQIQGPGF